MEQELREAKRVNNRYQKALERTEQLRTERETAIIKALRAGNTMASVARELGLTRARVGQIRDS